jgi:NAD(P)H-dependent FMN reductase
MNRGFKPIGAVIRAVTSEHSIALQAAAKAASPRLSMLEVRAMYVPACDPEQKPGEHVDLEPRQSAADHALQILAASNATDGS